MYLRYHYLKVLNVSRKSEAESYDTPLVVLGGSYKEQNRRHKAGKIT